MDIYVPVSFTVTFTLGNLGVSTMMTSKVPGFCRELIL
jgi:hypothetical protein